LSEGTEAFVGDEGFDRLLAGYRKKSEAAGRRSGRRFCTQCGKPLKAGAKFCTGCGAKLELS
ncbi:MAG: zinc ribbon domain-containing protein, partial [bacterium]|nr:zinc ribbon domain-containing protein [bacterium]